MYLIKSFDFDLPSMVLDLDLDLAASYFWVPDSAVAFGIFYLKRDALNIDRQM